MQVLGYALGRWLGLPSSLQKWIEQKYPKQFFFIQSKGVGVVVLAALPLPLSVASWVGGSLNLSFRCILCYIMRISQDDFIFIQYSWITYDWNRIILDLNRWFKCFF